MQYKIVEESDTDKLTKTVQNLLDDDWELEGGPFCFQQDNTTIFAQALSLDERESGQKLARLLGITQNQIPPNTEEIRNEIRERLTQLMDAKNSKTGSD